jgi:hypothetical protein
MHSVYDADLESRVLLREVALTQTDTLYPHVGASIPLGAVAGLIGLLLLARRDAKS